MQDRALHSHAPSPHLRVESADIVRQKPFTEELGPRRNTVPDLMLFPLDEGIDQQVRHTDSRTVVQRPTTAIKQTPSITANPYRRSRSADFLTQLTNTVDAQQEPRDRNEEIAYWRKSIIAEPLPALQDVSQSHVNESNRTSRSRPSIEPIQDFDFGLQPTTKISESSTLSERINTIEVKLRDFEYAISNLQGNDTVAPVPRGIVHGREYTRVDLTGERGRSKGNSNDQVRIPTQDHDNSDRNSKATTIRLQSGRPSSGRSHTRSSGSKSFKDKYEELYELLHQERLAREQLETRLIQLSKEVHILKSPAYTYTHHTVYPTPSPDSYQNSSILLEDHNMIDQRSNRNEQVLETSRFSMTETDSDFDVGNTPDEIYKTPRENTFHFDTQRIHNTAMI